MHGQGEIMPLHVTVEKSDKILIGDDVVIDVRRVGVKPQLSIEAPPEVKIQAVYKDSKRQLESMRGGLNGKTD